MKEDNGKDEKPTKYYLPLFNTRVLPLVFGDQDVGGKTSIFLSTLFPENERDHRFRRHSQYSHLKIHIITCYPLKKIHKASYQ